MSCLLGPFRRGRPLGYAFILLGSTLTASCISNAPPAAEAPPPTAYQPNFKYSVAESGKKVDVTVGIVAPQFSEDGAEWWKKQRGDEMSSAMIKNLKASFAELLTAKGFNTTGPFDSVDDMTFPDKKSSDLVLYPTFNVDISMSSIGGVAAAAPAKTKAQPLFSFGSGSQPNSSAPSGCSATVKMSGTISLIVEEPMSNVKLWNKKIDITQPTQNLTFEGAECVVENGQTVTRGARDAWAKTNEDVFQNVMKSLDRYVNAEEFQGFKHDAMEARAKKVY